MATEAIGLDFGVLNAWLIWIVPFIAALIIPAVGKGSKKATGYVAVGLSLASALFAASLLPGALEAHEVHEQISWISSIGLKAGVLADPLAVIMANVVGWISFLIMVYRLVYMKGDKDIVRFWFWMTFFIGSMQLIVLSDNLLQLFFGWEGVGLASYALISFWYRDKAQHHVGREGYTALGLMEYYSPTHAGMKAFIMTKVGDVMMLAGMFLIFAFAGKFGFREIVAWVGSITAILLATQGMVNTEIKKVLAYSTGSQIGYMMMALGIAGLSEQFVDGYTAGFFHLISHAMFKASLFMAAGSLLHVVGSRFMTDMGGLRKQMRKTYAFMWAAGLALMGAPFITTGFWSKDAIFAAVYESGNTWALPIFIIAVLTAVITAFYTTRMIGMVFFGKNSKHIEKMESEGHHIHEAPKSMWIPYGILAVLTIGIGI